MSHARPDCATLNGWDAEVTAMAAHGVAMEALSALALRKRSGQPVRFEMGHGGPRA